MPVDGRSVALTELTTDTPTYTLLVGTRLDLQDGGYETVHYSFSGLEPFGGLDHRFGHRGGRSWPPPVALTPAYVMFGQFRT